MTSAGAGTLSHPKRTREKSVTKLALVEFWRIAAAKQAGGTSFQYKVFLIVIGAKM